MDRPFRAYEGSASFVFVCYAHDDAELVYPELSRLHSYGFNIWYDEGITPGSDWTESIAQHIQDCAVFLYFVTPRSVEREHCLREVNFALDQRCAILPVHLQETAVPAPLALSLSRQQAIMRDAYSRSAYEEKLNRALEQAAIGRSQAAEGAPLRLGLGDWQLDVLDQRLRRDDSEKLLEPKELSVLLHLAAHPQELVPTEVLLARNWPGSVVGDNALHQAIAGLRKAFEDDARDPRYIETLTKRGYRLLVPVVELTEAASAESEATSRQEDDNRTVGSDPPRWPRWALPALALVVLAGTVTLWQGQVSDADLPEFAAAGQLPAIAVMRFRNLSAEPDYEVFAEGIAEDILNRLSRSRSLIVRPRTSSFTVKPSSDMQAIGELLNVAYLLEGSVRWSQSGFRINAQLVEVETNRSVWAGQYDRGLDEIFEVQDEVTSGVMSALRVPVETARLYRTEHLEAYGAFLRGRYHYNRFEFGLAERWLRESVDLDPEFADPWASLANILMTMISVGMVPPDGPERDLLHFYREKALSLSPEHPSARASKAIGMFSAKRSYQTSVDQLVELVRKSPNSPHVYNGLSMVLAALGHHELADEAAKRCVELDPLAQTPIATRIGNLISMGQAAKARDVYASYRDYLKDYRFEFDLAFADQDVEAMAAEIARGPGIFISPRYYLVFSALVPYLRGDMEEARRILQPLVADEGYQPFLLKHYVAMIQGDLSAAFDFHRSAIAAGEPIAILRAATGEQHWRRSFPEYFADPRYEQMLEDFGLDEAARTAIVIPELPF